MLTPAHHDVLARLLATDVPPQLHGASETFSAKDIGLLVEALTTIDPASIPIAQTQNVLGWITSISSYECSTTGATNHPLDHLIEFLRERELKGQP